MVALAHYKREPARQQTQANILTLEYIQLLFIVPLTGCRRSNRQYPSPAEANAASPLSAQLFNASFGCGSGCVATPASSGTSVVSALSCQAMEQVAAGPRNSQAGSGSGDDHDAGVLRRP